MSNGREEAGGREASLRRVAIVLSSLPQLVANRLLENFTPEARRRLHHAIRHLGDVEPWERRLALQSFSGSMQQQQNIEDEAVFSEAATATADAVPTKHSQQAKASQQANGSQQNGPASPEKQPSPLAFLHAVPDESLVALLAGEHPQTIALVLASIEPTQAARVLPRLHPVQRQEAISRIGRLGEIPADAVTEIADHLRSRVAPGSSLAPGSSRANESNGQRALTAIFAQLSQPSAEAGTGTTTASTVGRQASDAPTRDFRAGNQPEDSAFQQILRLRQLRDQVDARENAEQPKASGSHDSSRPAAGHGVNREDRGENRHGSLTDAALDELATSRQTADAYAAGGGAGSPSGDGQAGDGQAGHAQAGRPQSTSGDDRRSQETQPSGSGSEWWSTDDVHQHLIRLPAQELCRALGKVPTRQALLTLCGLPIEVAEAVLKLLPRAQEKTVRRQLTALGSLRLRDIDEAKELVARVSWGESLQPGSTMADSAMAADVTSDHEPVAA